MTCGRLQWRVVGCSDAIGWLQWRVIGCSDLWLVAVANGWQQSQKVGCRVLWSFVVMCGCVVALWLVLVMQGRVCGSNHKLLVAVMCDFCGWAPLACYWLQWSVVGCNGLWLVTGACGLLRWSMDHFSKVFPVPFGLSGLNKQKISSVTLLDWSL